jgi:hypothetical protein
VLCKTRNRSEALVPVQRLPPEILVAIFEETIGLRCIQCLPSPPVPVPLLVISSVSNYWRQVTISTPALWSHVDIGKNNAHLRVKLWIERSQNHPLFVHLNAFTTSQAIPKVIELLAPHVSRISSFQLRDITRNLGHKPTYAMLDLLRGGLAPVKKLFVTYRDSGSHAEEERFPSASWDEFLLPLRVLDLENVWVNWGSSAFVGLVSLRIEFPRNTPTSSSHSLFPTSRNISRVLSASPHLRSLVLVGVGIAPGELSRSSPIRLEHLEVLGLHYMSDPAYQTLLPLIAPGAKDLTLEISLNNRQFNFRSELESFFKRSSITTLRLTADRRDIVLPGLKLGLLSKLQDLYLEKFVDLALPLRGMIQITGSGFESSLIPGLKTIRIHQCALELLQLVKLTRASSLQRIVLSDCHVHPFSGTVSTGQSIHRIQGVLSMFVPSLTVINA